MIINFLYSGSSGNATLIQSDDKKTNILLDAGLSLKRLKEKFDFDSISLDAILITHEHSDHIAGLGPIGRKYNCPIYLPEPSFEKIENLLDKCNVQLINGGAEININNFEIKSFSTKHDSLGSLGYTVLDKNVNKKFGFLTDTGVFTKLMIKELSTCNACFIEADYDEEGLEKYAEYDDFLKDRIRSPLGHLSNQKTLNFLIDTLDLTKLEFVMLGHLSKNTNSPEILSSRIEEMIPAEFREKLNIITDLTVKTL
jgi:phosphoribosyl 1,2-cyclic phosphodiesterase